MANTSRGKIYATDSVAQQRRESYCDSDRSKACTGATDPRDRLAIIRRDSPGATFKNRQITSWSSAELPSQLRRCSGTQFEVDRPSCNGGFGSQLLTSALYVRSSKFTLDPVRLPPDFSRRDLESSRVVKLRIPFQTPLEFSFRSMSADALRCSTVATSQSFSLHRLNRETVLRSSIRPETLS